MKKIITCLFLILSTLTYADEPPTVSLRCQIINHEGFERPFDVTFNSENLAMPFFYHRKRLAMFWIEKYDNVWSVWTGPANTADGVRSSLVRSFDVNDMKVGKEFTGRIPYNVFKMRYYTLKCIPTFVGHSMLPIFPLTNPLSR